VFQDFEGCHGNFHPESYRAVQANPEWSKRLDKVYTAGRWVPRSKDRVRHELDCANSSDALLMNIFCYPGVFSVPAVCAQLGIDLDHTPVFGFRPRTPLAKGLCDRTEIDMVVGSLLVEAKLTESGFQTAPKSRLLQYRDLDECFEVSQLPIVGESVSSYQLIRAVLAAAHLNARFAVLCDGRRLDLIEQWFRVISAVRNCELRSRLSVLTWQELSRTLPGPLQSFLAEKYDIHDAAR
jgi:hypothetical protein